MKAPTVYAIVVNYNGWLDTVECVESLLQSNYSDLRVLILDNASRDGSLECLQNWALGAAPVSARTNSHAPLPPLGTAPKPIEMTVCSQRDIEAGQQAELPAKLILVECATNLGFAGANNVALRYLLRQERPAYALLLNNDAVIASDAVRAMVQLAECTPNVGAVGATILCYDRPERVEMLAGATVNPVNGMVKPIHPDAPRSAPRPGSVAMDYVSGCCLLVSVSAAERVGPMDERYFLYSEDVDWGIRMRKAGMRLIYCPSAEVWHKGGASVVHRSAIHDYYMVRGALMLVQKHFAAMLPVAMVHWLWRGILPKLMRREWDRLLAASRGYRDFLLQALGRAKARTV